MNKVIFASFDTEQKAYDGGRALRELHNEGTLTLFDNAVVVKDAAGKVSVKQEPDVVPAATLGGMVTGGMIGLLGGPVGVAIGLSTGTALGAAFDLTRQGINEDFVRDAGTLLAPGKAAVIAEIDESWQVPLDTRIESLGGTIVRKSYMQIDDAYYERDIEAAQQELAALEAEKLAAIKQKGTDKSKQQSAKLQSKIDAAKRSITAKEDALAAKLNAVKQEGAKKVAALEAQRITATVESKTQLEQRLVDVKKDYDGRIARMRDALARRKAAHASAA